MGRINWSRPRKVHKPWYEKDHERDVTGAPVAKRKVKKTVRVAYAQPCVLQTTADPDDDFFAMLAVGDPSNSQGLASNSQDCGSNSIGSCSSLTGSDGSLSGSPTSTDRIEAAKATLISAKSAVVHCDGGCEPNPGDGGWGVTIDVAGIPTTNLWGGVADTTNNRMELTAAIVTLSVLPVECDVTIFSDSQYLIKGMTLWLAGWKRRGFRRGDGTVPNADLWRSLDALSAGRTVHWRWVRGHNGHAGNERADGLATRGMREARE